MTQVLQSLNVGALLESPVLQTTGDLKQTYLVVAAIAVSFYILEAILVVSLKPLLLRLLNAKSGDKKAAGAAVQAVARITGSFHNNAQVPLALYVLLSFGIETSDRMFAHTPWSQLMCLVSAGYFLHDLVICLARFELEGPAYTAHALCCHLAYLYGAYSGMVHWHGAAFLMFEISTPFVHIRWFMYKMKQDHTTLYFLNGIAMILAFFGCRIVWGYYETYRLVRDVIGERYKPDSPFPTSATVAYCIAGAVMTYLNTTWFYLMVKKAAMVVIGGKKASEVGHDKDD